VHSATKYLGGHSDIIAGAAAGSRKWMDRVRHMVIYLGGSMDPGAAFLLIRGMKTMGVRVAQQCAAIHVLRFFVFAEIVVRDGQIQRGFHTADGSSTAVPGNR